MKQQVNRNGRWGWLKNIEALEHSQQGDQGPGTLVTRDLVNSLHPAATADADDKQMSASPPLYGRKVLPNS
ncbi:hypothetical protein, partial [Salmonella sp. s55004]|uniref:hypothetical protein n=1 Tax=Salmonella sp. s55004 TaxID=3159675 RepID=UPI00397FA012